MDTRVIFGSMAVLLFATGPALAQFGPGSGTAGSTPSISGAGTGLSAPSGIRPSGNAIGSPNANPNALPGLSTPTPVPAPQVYPGVGAGGVGLPPPAVAVPGRSAANGTTRPR